jgi:hypothetical protein
VGSVSRLFGAYIIVDWSAAEGRGTGANSVWLAVIKRDVRFRLTAPELHNPPTRAEAAALLRSLLADLARRNEKALIGFDFNLGFPEGTAERMKLEGEPWAALWKFLGARVVDKPDNTNNRFQVAATMNRLMTGAARPFWGAPARQAQTTLSSTKPPAGAVDVPREFRRTELATQGKGKAGAKSVWQMHGAGVVGGQTLLGIAAAKRLLDELGPAGAVWPFSFGWRAPTPADLEPLRALLVEVYPSIFPVAPEAGEVKDRAQVRAVAEHLARLDEQGRLAALFNPPMTVKPEDVAAVEREEGWILGAGVAA